MKCAQSTVTARLDRQHGVISRTQALEDGMSPQQVTRAVHAGAWEPLHQGVYHLRAVR